MITRMTMLLLCGMLTGRCMGQDSGIRFESNLSWTEVLTRAKAEQKPIFLDCYTTWCGPCRWMKNNIFTQREVGAYFNTHFINVSVQMDKTSKDSADIRTWYAVADSLSRVYDIHSYPTFLFISPDGQALHRVIGRSDDAQGFISVGIDALDSTRQYYGLVRNWPRHLGDSAYLRNALNKAFEVGDVPNLLAIGDAYLGSVSNLLVKDNIQMIEQLIPVENSSTGKWFGVFKDNVTEINRIMGNKRYVQWALGWTIICNEELVPPFKQRKYPIRWDSLAARISKKYPALGVELDTLMSYQFRNLVTEDILRLESLPEIDAASDWKRVARTTHDNIVSFDLHQLLLTEEARFWAKKKNWTKCGDVAYRLMKAYGAQIGQHDINNISWDYIFKHCDGRKELNESIKWMKFYIDLDSNRSGFMDTYANLLYKAGRRDQAIVWEKKAIEVEARRSRSSPDMEEYKGALAKMENGTPTWN